MLNLFLTGTVHIGKSTLIRRVLDLYPNLSIGGFRTVLHATSSGERGVFLLPAASDDSACNATNCVGIRKYDHCLCYPSTFDTLGVATLQSDNHNLLLMDELGFMETDAHNFCNAVLKALDGCTTVLGVVKQRSTPFLDTVRSHPRTRLFTVTEANRDSLIEQLAYELCRSVHQYQKDRR